jgi:hypothetical protein
MSEPSTAQIDEGHLIGRNPKAMSLAHLRSLGHPETLQYPGRGSGASQLAHIAQFWAVQWPCQSDEIVGRMTDAQGRVSNAYLSNRVPALTPSTGAALIEAFTFIQRRGSR